MKYLVALLLVFSQLHLSAQDLDYYEFLDHRDLSMQVVDFFPYQGGAIYVVNASQRPMCRIYFIDAAGISHTIHEQTYLTPSIVDHIILEDGSAQITLSLLIDYDVILNGSIFINYKEGNTTVQDFSYFTDGLVVHEYFANALHHYQAEDGNYQVSIITERLGESSIVEQYALDGNMVEQHNYDLPLMNTVYFNNELIGLTENKIYTLATETEIFATDDAFVDAQVVDDQLYLLTEKQFFILDTNYAIIKQITTLPSSYKKEYFSNFGKYFSKKDHIILFIGQADFSNMIYEYDLNLDTFINEQMETYPDLRYDYVASTGDHLFTMQKYLTHPVIRKIPALGNYDFERVDLVMEDSSFLPDSMETFYINGNMDTIYMMSYFLNFEIDAYNNGDDINFVSVFSDPLENNFWGRSNLNYVDSIYHQSMSAKVYELRYAFNFDFNPPTNPELYIPGADFKLDKDPSDNSILASPVANENIAWDHTIKIYPNPATDYITIEDLEPNINGQIYDVNGKLIDHIMIPFSRKIDVRQLSAGQLYFIIFDGRVGVSFIKN